VDRRALGWLVALALSACGGGDAPAGDVDAAGARDVTTARPRGEAVLGRDGVVAIVDGSAIGIDEVEAVVRATGIAPIDALRRLEEERVLAARAEREADRDPAARGDDDAIRRAAVQALLERTIEREIRPETIAQDAIERRMAEQIARFRRPEQRRSAHLLARVPPGAPEEVAAAAERFVRGAIERLARADDPIAAARAIAGEVGDRRTFQARVEELPAFARTGRLVPEYLEAMFAAPAPGLVPEAVRTRFGWHAIVVTAIEPAWEAPQAEIEATIRDELVVELRAERLEARLAELAASARIERDEAAIERAMEIELEPSEP
jgi:peptidyl-prolyl cis-trans isomerase C